MAGLQQLSQIEMEHPILEIHWPREKQIIVTLGGLCKAFAFSLEAVVAGRSSWKS